MRPPMKQKLWFNVASETGETDRYGDPIMTEEIKRYPARVREEVNRIQQSDGSFYDTDLEIDVLSSAEVHAKQDINFTRIDGTEGSGTIEKIADSTNLAGNKIYFKVLMVDGKG